MPRHGGKPRSRSRLFTTLVLLATVGLSSCIPKPIHISLEQQEQRLVAYMSSVTVTIATLNKGVIGSGVVLKHQTGERLQVLSAGHVWEAIFLRNLIGGCASQDRASCTNSLMFFENEKPIPLRIKKHNPSKDLVLLESIGPMLTRGPSARVSSNTPSRGSFVWTLGSPAGQRGTVTRGIVSNIITWVNVEGRRIKQGLTWIDIDSSVYYGNSGGPTFGSNGEVIGIVIYRSPWGGGRALAGKHIKSFLEEEK